MWTSRMTTVLAAGVLALAGCGSDGGSDGGSEGGGAGPAPAAGGDAVLATAGTALGTVVVDGEGRTVYVFDKDTPGSGESACSDACLEAWPPVTTESDDPEVDGVTGEVGTITREDGTTQLTLEGRPLYLWQGDAEPGDVTGQGVQDVWWVVAPDGTKITSLPAGDPGY